VRAPRVPVLDALHDAPAFGVEPAAHLLSALATEYPSGSVFLAVVDPGVGGKRDPIVIQADGRTFVGPDNGLLSVLWQRARRRKCFRIAWHPKRLTSSFHGRDLFAPVAAALALKRMPRGWLAEKSSPDVLLDPGDLAKVIYVDHYGNCVTGLRTNSVTRSARIRARGRFLRYTRTFEDAKGPFWYENSMGLVEIAAPGASAARLLRLRAGYAIRIAPGP
jgi:S-adenosylmethionine hydrolase